MTSLDDRICIIGAGPGGLSAAHFLKKRGYRRVTVLEAADRVGGKCLTVTYRGRAFDIGANYVTSDYREVRRLAGDFGAALYTEAPMTTVQFPANGPPRFATPLGMLAARVSISKALWAVLRYFRIRLQLRDVIDAPNFAGLSRRPELCRPFADWLATHGLTILAPMFELPITAMGYGRLDEIPAPYALKYMSPKTFLDMTLVGLGLPTRWPKRFVDGFQSLWRKIAADLDVRLSVQIRRIERAGTVCVHIESAGATQVLEFDHLILASPLQTRSLETFLSLSLAERRLFDQVVVNPFAVTTEIVERMHTPRRIIFVLPAPALGEPGAMAQQFAENPFWQFYTPLDRDRPISAAAVSGAVRQTISRLGGRVADHDQGTCTTWDYFPHVGAQAIAAGFYDELEALQGEQHTFYCGGLLAFELVEPIVRYSSHLIETRF